MILKMSQKIQENLLIGIDKNNPTKLNEWHFGHFTIGVEFLT